MCRYDMGVALVKLLKGLMVETNRVPGKGALAQLKGGSSKGDAVLAAKQRPETRADTALGPEFPDEFS